MSLSFTLQRHQVPEPPEGSDQWSDWLRWLVMVMNPTDPQFPLIASLLHYAAQNGAQTQRQAKAANRTIARVHDAYSVGDLLCMKSGPESADVVLLGPRIAIDNTKGAS